MTQDLELTVEQAEEATKKAAHKAAVALGIASDDQPVKLPSKSSPTRAKETSPLPPSMRKPKA